MYRVGSYICLLKKIARVFVTLVLHYDTFKYENQYEIIIEHNYTPWFMYNSRDCYNVRIALCLYQYMYSYM